MINKDYNSEDDINFIVDNYKESGYEGYKVQLLNEFEGYFIKYANLLCSRSAINLDNKDTITFLRLFMNDEERADQKSMFKAARRIINYLRLLFRDYTRQDIHDEVALYFLEQLERYKPMIAKNKKIKHRISFTHFVQVNIRFRIKALCMVRQKDAMSCANNVEYNDEINTYKLDNGLQEVNWADIDVQWVKGNTASDVFKELSDLDRYLLYLKYHRDFDKPLSDYSLARITGMDRMYIRRKMLSINERVKKLVEVN